MKWEFDDSMPIFLQIREQITREIISGKLKPGDNFPTVRDLASEARVNRNTMQRALSCLEQDKLLITNRTSGRQITSDKNLIQELKYSYAQELLQNCLNKLLELGFKKSDIQELIKKQGGNNE